MTDQSPEPRYRPRTTAWLDLQNRWSGEVAGSAIISTSVTIWAIVPETVARLVSRIRPRLK